MCFLVVLGWHKACLQCLGFVGEIQPEGQPVVGTQRDGVPQFLLGMDREGNLNLQLLLFFSGVHLGEHVGISDERW